MGGNRSRGQRKSVVLSSSAIFSLEVKMFAIAIAALLVFSVTAQAAKYDYDSYKPSYESAYYGRNAYSEEPSYTYEPRSTYKQSYEPRSAYRYRREASTGREG